MTEINYISENIHFFRNHLNLSREEFADKLGITAAQVYTYEKRGTMPKSHVLKKIAEIAGVDIPSITYVRINSDILHNWPHDKSGKPIKNLHLKKDFLIKHGDQTKSKNLSEGAPFTISDKGKKIKNLSIDDAQKILLLCDELSMLETELDQYKKLCEDQRELINNLKAELKTKSN